MLHCVDLKLIICFRFIKKDAIENTRMYSYRDHCHIIYCWIDLLSLFFMSFGRRRQWKRCLVLIIVLSKSIPSQTARANFDIQSQIVQVHQYSMIYQCNWSSYLKKWYLHVRNLFLLGKISLQVIELLLISKWIWKKMAIEGKTHSTATNGFSLRAHRIFRRLNQSLTKSLEEKCFLMDPRLDVDVSVLLIQFSNFSSWKSSFVGLSF